MSISSIKKILLAGTALVAVSAFSSQAQAVETAPGTWGSAGSAGLYTGADIAHAAAGDNLALAAAVGLVTNDGVSQDSGGDGLNTFTINGVTTGAAGQLSVTTGAANHDLIVNIDHLTTTVTTLATLINNTGNSTYGTTVNFANAYNSGGIAGMTILNSAAVAKTVNVVIGGNVSSGLTTALTAGSVSGADTNLTLNGTTNSLNAVTLTDTAGGATGHSTLTLGGNNAAQTFAGTITGGAANEGVLTISNTGAASGFTGVISNLRAINAGVTGNTTTFNSATSATTLNMTGTGTVAFGANLFTGNIAFGANDGLITSSTGGITGNIDETATGTSVGTLTLTGADAFAGTIGATQAIKAINAGAGASSFSGVVKSVALTFNGANTVSLNGAGANAITTTAFSTFDGTLALATTANLTGAITTATVDQGTVSLAGASTITGTIGTSAGTEIKLLSGGVQNTASSVTGAVYAKTITIDGGASAATTGSLGFGSTVNVTTDLTVSSHGTANAQVENSTITGILTDLGTLHVTAAATAGANATLTLNGATNTITGLTTLTNSGATATLAVGSGSSLALNGGIAGAGTLNMVGGTQTLSGTVSDASLTINAGATSATTTFGDMTAGTINATGTGVGTGGHLNLNGNTTANLLFGAASTDTATIAAGKTFTGTMGGTGGAVGAGIGNVVFAGTTARSVSTIGATGILKSLTLNNPTAGTPASVTTTGAVLAADTNTLGINTLNAGTTYGIGAAQTLSSTYDGTNYGKVAAGGHATTTTMTAVNLTIAPTVYIPTTTFTIVGGSAGGSVAVLANSMLTVNGITDTGFQTLTEGLMTYTQAVDTDNLKITATRATAASIGSAGNNSAVGAALDAITTTGVTAVDVLQGTLASQTTAAGVNNVLSTATPTVDGGAQMSALEVTSQLQDITGTRMAALRNDDSTTGVAAGVTANGVSMWLQGYGQGGTQDTRDAIAGYTAKTWGGAVGVDMTNMVNDGVIGFALNYGKSTIDSKNLNTTTTDVNNYGLTLYSTLGLGQQMFVDSQLGYAYNKVGSDRHNVGFAGVTASGRTNSDQYNAKVALGRDYAVDNGTILTPDVSAAYTYLNTKGYTETGSGANLSVGSSSQSVLNLGIGVKAAWKLKNADGSMMKPTLNVGYAYDAIGDRIDTTSTFVGSPGSAFVTAGPRPERNQFNAGAGFTYMTTANWDMSANYNYQYKTSYQSHTGTVRATAHF